MSDTSRKRSRKSKLVPRECTIESEDDDVDLQAPVNKVPKNIKQYTKKKVIKKKVATILKKISKPAKENTLPSPIKFDIEVEVEKCDDYSVQIHAHSGEDSTTENTPEPVPMSSKKANLLRTYTAYKKMNSEQDKLSDLPIILTETEILDAADQILATSDNVADKILDNGLRNTIGHGLKGKQYDNIHENNIQEVLDEWRSWQFRSFHRQSPLFYKCYVCDKSWWYLSDFRNHITQHPEINIALETYERHEANMIAYRISKPDVRDIYTEGVCQLCGKDFDAHKLSARIQKKYYGNEGCTKQFFNCIGLKEHTSCYSCSQCGKENKEYRCEICKSTYETEEMKDQHLVISHTVRSDVPIMSRYKTCKVCSARYCCLYLHVCGKKCPHFQCNYCFRSFSSKILIELHMESSSEACTCQICGQTLHWSCKIYEHMMKHTDKYMLVRKCVKCDDMKVFLTSNAAYKHRFKEHSMDKDMKHQSYFTKIIVPKSCIELPEESVSKSESVSECKKESVPEFEQESVQVTEQESVPEYENENVSIKDESQYNDETPSFLIKEEPIDVYEDSLEEVHAENYDPEVNIKQEIDDYEIDEYEDDIIKLNIDINEHFMIVKSEPEDATTEPTESPNNQESIVATTESEPIIVKEESILEPEIIIGNKQTVIVSCKRRRVYKCTKCDFKARHREYKDHIETNCKKSDARIQIFLCTKCAVGFPSMKKYLAHFVQHGYKCLSCPECFKQFYSFTKLTPHVRSHIKQAFVRVKSITSEGSPLKPEFQCKRCSEIVELDEFFDHWELHVTSRPEKTVEHMPPRYHQCEEEIQGDIIRESINRLMKQPKKCNQCHRDFKRINECKRHIIEHLLTDAYTHKHITGDLVCQMCNSPFLTPEKYKQHMRDHASLPVYKCELCDRTFSDSSNFTKHKKVHNLRVFVCDLCGKKFQSKLSLTSHLEKHRSTEPITCEQCDKLFFFESTYRRHIRYFHEKTTLGFRCVICNKRFETLKLKWNHMWEVHKERKNKADCPICFESFRKYSDVRAHAKKMHNTEVSVYSVKHATNSSSVVDIEKLLQHSSDFKLGEAETLVVFE